MAGIARRRALPLASNHAYSDAHPVNATVDAMPASPPPLPPAAPARSAGVGEAIGLLALYFGLQFAVGLVGMAAVGMVIGLRTGLTGGPSAVLQAALADPDLRTGITAGTLLVAAGITLWLIHRWWPRQWRLGVAWQGFGFAPSSSAAFYAAALALGVAAPVFGGVLTHWLAGDHPVTQSIAQMGRTAVLWERIVLALLAVSIGPLVEETMFRGVLFSALLGFRRRDPMPGNPGRQRIALAMLVSAALFATVHLPDLGWQWYALPDLALLGLGCAWLRLHSGSLWPAVLAHGVNNLLAVAGWFVMTHPPG